MTIFGVYTRHYLDLRRDRWTDKLIYIVTAGSLHALGEALKKAHLDPDQFVIKDLGPA